jgi:anaerobic selenocysteine-containing dehydrogenase
MKPVDVVTPRTVASVCPLDCPDSCSLQVSVDRGRVVGVDGSSEHSVTAGFICAKVRRMPERLYGPDRIHHPMVRRGAKGDARFERASWDSALTLVAEKLLATRAEFGGESILPYSYGGSNGLLTQDTIDATLFRRLGASRLARTVCAAPTGAANMALYGKMPSVTYEDYAEARLLVLWGVNPSASAIHMVPFIREVQRRGGKLVVVDPRSTPLARQADLHLAVRPGTDLPVALAVHRFLFEHGLADTRFLETFAHGADRLRERALPWTVERAAHEAGVEPVQLETFARMYAEATPALIRCGWGQERNRNGGSSSMAILALPAVAGKFGVRGGGYAMSNSASWNITRSWVSTPDPPTRVINMNQLGRALLDATPPVMALFVYNSNPVATSPDQRRIIRGLEREDLFTVVFEQVMTDTARYADVLLPATTFLEHYELARAYGPLSLRLSAPVVEPVGEARSNADVFGELLRLTDLARSGDATGELEAMLDVIDRLPEGCADQVRLKGVASPPFDGRPVQFQTVWPGTPDGRVNLYPEALEAGTPSGLYVYQPDPATADYPLALISPASERSVSSTLAELPRPEARLTIHPDDAADRGIEDGDAVRVFNALGEVHCRATVAAWVRSGTVSLPKGLWRRHTTNGYTTTALVSDALTDLGGGACFNDARVQVALAANA